MVSTERSVDGFRRGPFGRGPGAPGPCGQKSRARTNSSGTNASSDNCELCGRRPRHVACSASGVCVRCSVGTRPLRTAAPNTGGCARQSVPLCPLPSAAAVPNLARRVLHWCSASASPASSTASGRRAAQLDDRPRHHSAREGHQRSIPGACACWGERRPGSFSLAASSRARAKAAVPTGRWPAQASSARHLTHLVA